MEKIKSYDDKTGFQCCILSIPGFFNDYPDSPSQFFVGETYDLHLFAVTDPLRAMHFHNKYDAQSYWDEYKDKFFKDNEDIRFDNEQVKIREIHLK